MGAGGRRPAWHPLCSPGAQIIQKQIFLFRGEIFLCKGRCCWGRGGRIQGNRAVFLGGQLCFATEAGKSQRWERPEPGAERVLVLLACLFWVGK